MVDKKFALCYGRITAKNEENNERIKYHHFATSNDFMDVGTDYLGQRESYAVWTS